MAVHELAEVGEAGRGVHFLHFDGSAEGCGCREGSVRSEGSRRERAEEATSHGQQTSESGVG